MVSTKPVIFVVEPFGGSIRWHNPSLPLIYWDDYAVTRGDGIFESILIRDGQAANIERHAQRFRTSAEALGLPEPIIESWISATNAAIEEFGDGEGKCTWTYSRGRASTGLPTAWVAIQPIADDVLAQRDNGVRVMLSERGWSFPSELPAKTLNYAATMATLRLARDRGFDDVIFTDPYEGHVLEGATSTVVTVKGDKLRTPYDDTILPGTTQAALFEYAESQGYRCKQKVLDVDYLLDADSVWLVSSIRVAARVRRLGEHKLKAPDNEQEIRSLIDTAMSAN
ncbi:MAG: aminodeoxychorismate lyase [Corynebacterium casei]|uniref:4-amino-4-deoxychorismate lyase n=1 Tax=Corynebacterium casei LMG S-19264 TaxID=1285583 RepID=A0ABM5PSB1_9CORY|nr:aminodeoxychorismate lyase [Corynebacterium casei]AHI20985.1 4-amino-4-deoxychorismate lyase [Corynebacterium casei LMG S-19264]MDN5705578.1 aminodeoxychorismate lyase [Corynebacterium casei]MDN5727957.1 aminodeoxychorismate lyase [Corynebacterium casei]MDN5740107.1 aminodeoxychorismate lyase [Corynebacterium casei]MDN5783336.1 aminodeoxychorismate lyase [Corynebacterium casei]